MGLGRARGGVPREGRSRPAWRVTGAYRSAPRGGPSSSAARPWGAAKAGPGSAGPPAPRAVPLPLALRASLPSTRTLFGLDFVAAELVAERGEDLGAVRVVLAGTEASLERQRDDRRRDVVVDRLLHGPASLARVGDIALQVLEVGAVCLERAAGELEQPRPHDRALHPQLGDPAEVQVVVARVHDLEAFGIGLHQAVLDPVVDHLHVVPGARSADVEIPAGRCERGEDGDQRVDRGGVAADHQAIADLEPPDPARRARVDIADALLLEHGVTPDVVVEVRVAAVDDRVTRLEVLEELVDLRFGRVTCRDHDPDGTWLLQRADEIGDRECRRRPLGSDLARLLRCPVVDHDVVAVAHEPADHVGPHPAQTDEPDAHCRQASVGVSVVRAVGRSRARSSAASSAVNPASGSAPRWTRTIGRSCPSMAAKSPAAWASMSWPKLYGQPGMSMSSG